MASYMVRVTYLAPSGETTVETTVIAEPEEVLKVVEGFYPTWVECRYWLLAQPESAVMLNRSMTGGVR